MSHAGIFAVAKHGKTRARQRDRGSRVSGEGVRYLALDRFAVACVAAVEGEGFPGNLDPGRAVRQPNVIPDRRLLRDRIAQIGLALPRAPDDAREMAPRFGMPRAKGKLPDPPRENPVR